MQDFAALLVNARTKAGLTQAQLAISAGLTPSYLSFIENRKKPPPSDDVCRRLAKVLKIPAKTVIEVAHMERAPETVRKRMDLLHRSLRKERRSRARVLRWLLSPFLFAGPPGFRESALDAIGISPVRRKRIREVLSAVGRDHQDREKEISRIVDELPERERDLLLEKLPTMLARAQSAEAKGGAAPGRGADRSKEGRSKTGKKEKRSEGVPGSEPPLLYDAPDAELECEGPYRLAVTEEVAEAFEDLREGDLLVADPSLRPGLGDLMVLRGGEGYRLRRLEAAGDGFAFALDLPEVAADLVPAEQLEARLAAVCAGTVIEIRRPMRRRPRV